jgi:hypothetical protein
MGVTKGIERKLGVRCGVFTALLSILASLITSIATPLAAQAFSNATSFNLAKSIAYVEDVALCTSYKYTFDSNNNFGGPWNQVGYETCPSESLTTTNLPATLHYKLRVESRAPEEYGTSTVDAYISDAKGNKISTPRWAPTPLVNLDTPQGPNNVRFYGAFQLPNSTIFPVGSYQVTIQLFNTQWVKLNGPNLPETPQSLNIFAFNIYPGQPATPQPVTAETSTCKFDSGFTAASNKIAATADSILNQSNSITDFGAPGILEKLKGWDETLNQDVLNLNMLRVKAYATYGKLSSGVTCDEYERFVAESTATVAKIAQISKNLVAYLVKAQSAAATVTEQIQSLSGQVETLKSKVAESSKSATNQEEDKYVDVEGEEEEPAATLSVTYSKTLARYIMKVESNLPDETLSIRATKKGARTIKFAINTDEIGNGGIRTTAKLAGYTLVLSLGSEKLDQVRVK